MTEGLLLLTRSKTTLARITHALTREPYPHASIVYAGDIVSVTRYDYRKMLPAGLTTETFEYGEGIPFKVYRVPIEVPPTRLHSIKFDLTRLFHGGAVHTKMVCTDLAHLCITGEIPSSLVLPHTLTGLDGVKYLGEGSFSVFGANAGSKTGKDLKWRDYNV